MLGVMFSLADCRKLLLRARWMRGLAVLLLLAVIASGLPRWEVHSHAIDDHHHGHAPLHADHQDDLTPSDAAPAPSPIVLHFHDTACPPAALCRVDVIALTAVPPATWVLPLQTDQVAYAAGPPPDRPPIV